MQVLPPYLNLNNYPIIQVAVFIVVVGTWIVAVVRARHRSDADDLGSGGHRTLIDGPVRAILESLEDLRRTGKSIDRRVEEALRELRVKHDARLASLQELHGTVEREVGAVKATVELLREQLRHN